MLPRSTEKEKKDTEESNFAWFKSGEFQDYMHIVQQVPTQGL